jgi:hypothetical protein
MTPHSITIELDSDAPRSSEMLSGVYFLPLPRRRMRLIELSVLWTTAGHGDKDCIIHHFDKWEIKAGAPHFDSNEPRRFSVLLGEGPHSYEGLVVKVRWLVRIRMVEEDGTEWLGEQLFRLGNTAPAVEVAATE